MTNKERKELVATIGKTIEHLQSKVQHYPDGSAIPDRELTRTINFLKAEQRRQQERVVSVKRGNRVLYRL